MLSPSSAAAGAESQTAPAPETKASGARDRPGERGARGEEGEPERGAAGKKWAGGGGRRGRQPAAILQLAHPAERQARGEKSNVQVSAAPAKARPAATKTS